MPRVLHFGWSFSNHLTHWLPGLSERGFENFVLSYGGEPLADFPSEIIARKPAGKLGYLLSLPQVRDYVRRIKPDLIHAHYAAGFGSWGAFAKSACGARPLIISCWGTDIVRSAKSAIGGPLIRWSLGRADQLVVPSGFLANQLGQLGVTKKTAPTIIPFGIDFTSSPFNNSRSANNSAEAPGKPVRLLFFKHHRIEYGADILLEAFARALKEIRPDLAVTLTLGGQGPLSEQLKSQAQELGVSGAVSFPGFVPHEKALEFIAGHDIMVMPTLVEEGFGVAALEAQALGLPVIASKTGGVPDIVIDGETGLLTPPGDIGALAKAMIVLISDAELRAKMGQAGAARVRRMFDHKKSLDKMAELYRLTLNSL